VKIGIRSIFFDTATITSRSARTVDVTVLDSLVDLSPSLYEVAKDRFIRPESGWPPRERLALPGG
jgi:hypothetical protein